MRDLVPETSGLSFWADYADDGVSGGDVDVVLQALRSEMLLA